MSEELYDFLQAVPLLLAISTLYWFSRKALKKETKEFKEEEARKARIAALSPPPPPYEERMGVQYGPTGTKE